VLLCSFPRAFFRRSGVCSPLVRRRGLLVAFPSVSFLCEGLFFSTTCDCVFLFFFLFFQQIEGEVAFTNPHLFFRRPALSPFFPVPSNRYQFFGIVSVRFSMFFFSSLHAGRRPPCSKMLLVLHPSLAFAFSAMAFANPLLRTFPFHKQALSSLFFWPLDFFFFPTRCGPRSGFFSITPFRTNGSLPRTWWA